MGNRLTTTIKSHQSKEPTSWHQQQPTDPAVPEDHDDHQLADLNPQVENAIRIIWSGSASSSSASANAESPMQPLLLDKYVEACGIVINSLDDSRNLSSSHAPAIGDDDAHAHHPAAVDRRRRQVVDTATARLARQVYQMEFWDKEVRRELIRELMHCDQAPGGTSFRYCSTASSPESSSESGGSRSSTSAAGDSPDNMLHHPCGELRRSTICCSRAEKAEKPICVTKIVLFGSNFQKSLVHSDSAVSVAALKRITQLFDDKHKQKLFTSLRHHRNMADRYFDSHGVTWIVEGSMMTFDDANNVNKKAIRRWIVALKVVVRVLQVMKEELCKLAQGDREHELMQIYFTHVAEAPVRRFLTAARTLANREWPAPMIGSMLLLLEAFDDVLRHHLPELLPSETDGMELILKKMELHVGDIFSKITNHFTVYQAANHDVERRNNDYHNAAVFLVKCIKLLLVHNTVVRPILAPNQDFETLSDHLLAAIASCEQCLNKCSSKGFTSAEQCIFLLNNADYLNRQGLQVEDGLLVQADLVQEHRASHDGRIKKLTQCYIQTCWEPPLSCLKPSCVGLFFPRKEQRLSRFRNCIDKALDDQAEFKVPDTNLRHRLRDAIAEHVVPPYEQFLEMSGDTSRSPDRQDPEELRQRLLQLFEG